MTFLCRYRETGTPGKTEDGCVLVCMYAGETSTRYCMKECSTVHLEREESLVDFVPFAAGYSQH